MSQALLTYEESLQWLVKGGEASLLHIRRRFPENYSLLRIRDKDITNACNSDPNNMILILQGLKYYLEKQNLQFSIPKVKRIIVEKKPRRRRQPRIPQLLREDHAVQDVIDQIITEPHTGLTSDIVNPERSAMQYRHSSFSDIDANQIRRSKRGAQRDSVQDQLQRHILQQAYSTNQDISQLSQEAFDHSHIQNMDEILLPDQNVPVFAIPGDDQDAEEAQPPVRRRRGPRGPAGPRGPRAPRLPHPQQSPEHGVLQALEDNVVPELPIQQTENGEASHVNQMELIPDEAQQPEVEGFEIPAIVPDILQDLEHPMEIIREVQDRESLPLPRRSSNFFGRKRRSSPSLVLRRRTQDSRGRRVPDDAPTSVAPRHKIRHKLVEEYYVIGERLVSGTRYNKLKRIRLDNDSNNGRLKRLLAFTESIQNGTIHVTINADLSVDSYEIASTEHDMDVDLDTDMDLDL